MTPFSEDRRNVVQSFWFGSRLTALQVLSLRSFVALGHDVHLYTFDRIDNVPDGIRLLDASTILPRDSVFTYVRGFGRGSPSAFSNLFRYKLLFEKGGWWVDTDVVCLRPFAIDSEFVFASERDVDGHVTAASCVIKSPPGAAWLQHCLAVAEERDKATLQWGEIGPKLVDAAITQFALRQFLVPPHVFNAIDYFAFDEIQAPAFDLQRLDESLGVHLWSQKWLSNCRDPDFDGAEDSLYATLRGRFLLPADRAYPADTAIESHAAFQIRCIDALLGERDEAQWATEVAAKEITGLRTELQRRHDLREQLQIATEGLREAQSRLRDAEALVRSGESLLNDTRVRLQDTEVRLRDTEAHLGDTETQRRTLDVQLRDSLRLLDQSRQEVASLHESISWRITRPLRALSDAIRKPGR